MEEICERVGADEGKTLGNLVLDNIPIALIVLMPVMALVLKALYPLSRRYFVEHLLFFVHFHSFFFLILTLLVLFARFGDLISLSEPATVLHSTFPCTCTRPCAGYTARVIPSLLPSTLPCRSPTRSAPL